LLEPLLEIRGFLKNIYLRGKKGKTLYSITLSYFCNTGQT